MWCNGWGTRQSFEVDGPWGGGASHLVVIAVTAALPDGWSLDAALAGVVDRSP